MALPDTEAVERAKAAAKAWTPPSWLTEGPVQGGIGPFPQVTADARWRRRPLVSALVRYTAAATPIAASVLAAFFLGRLLPAGHTVPRLVGWWLVILLASTVTLLAVDRMARRLLPLAVLLNLSMVFPDKAPDRFWAAFRAGAIRNLEQRIADARRQRSDDAPAKAAADIITLVAAITAHDRRTRGHSERVRAFNDLISEEMHLPEPDRERLRWAALLHDVGKIETPPSILNKPGPLTDEEWRKLHSHPEDGARISAPLHDWLGPWAAAIAQHHERWDGTGYPNGLAGGDISLGARIVAVADAYEVMTSPRPYRGAMSARAAREELARGAAGTQFDPTVVRAFLTISLGRLRRIAGPIAWLFQFPLLIPMSRVEGVAAAIGRQLAVSAGTVGAVGVLAVSGVIGAPPPAPITPQSVTADYGRVVERSAVPSPRTEAPGAAALPLAEPAVPTTPPSSKPSAVADRHGPDGSGGSETDHLEKTARPGTTLLTGRVPSFRQPLDEPVAERVPGIELPPIPEVPVLLPPTGTPVGDIAAP